MVRRLVLILLLIVIWAALCAWAAGVPWQAPWTTHERLALSGRDFYPEAGVAFNEPEGLAVRAFDANGAATQIARLPRVWAEKYPMLRYRISDFPDTLELALAFRRSDAPSEVQTISLPTSGSGEVAVDLSRFKQWRGEIRELGFTEYAAAQLVPPSVAASFRPFRIEWVQLQPPTWDIVPARLRGDWFGYRSWSFQSVNTIGPRPGMLDGSWMLPIVALGLALSGLTAWLLLRWSCSRAVTFACGVAVSAWLVLDLRWLGDFYAKHATTETIYGGKSWPQRAALQVDEDTQKAADDLGELVRLQGARRVLVHSDSSFAMLRLIYFLLPLDAAPLEQVTGAGSEIPRGALLVFQGGAWKFDEAAGRLENGERTIPAEAIYKNGDLRVFRYLGTGR